MTLTIYFKTLLRAAFVLKTLVCVITCHLQSAYWLRVMSPQNLISYIIIYYLYLIHIIHTHVKKKGREREWFISSLEPQWFTKLPLR